MFAKAKMAHQFDYEFAKINIVILIEKNNNNYNNIDFFFFIAEG